MAVFLVHLPTLGVAFMQLAIMRIVNKNSLGYLASCVQDDAGRYFAARARRVSAWVCMLLSCTLFFAIFFSIFFVDNSDIDQNLLVVSGIGFFFCALHLGAFLSLLFSTCAVLIHELHRLRVNIINHRISHGDSAKRYAKLRLALTQLSDDFSIGTVPFLVGGFLYSSTGWIESFFAANAGVNITPSTLVAYVAASIFCDVILFPLASVTLFSERCRTGAQRAAGLEAAVKRTAGAAGDNSVQLFVTYFNAVAGEPMRVGPWDISFALIARTFYLIGAASVSVYAAVLATS